VALIFLPITFVTGIFGMSVAGLSGVENTHAFFIVTGAVWVISLVVVGLLKLKRWF
jgi:zinc transporter